MRIAIFGAGQAGRMAASWLPAQAELVCFIDNDKRKQGQSLDGYPICSLEQALAQNPEAILLTILNREAAAQIKTDLAQHFPGKIWDVQELRLFLDIRLSALRLLARQLRDREVPGAMAELGVYKGLFSAEMNRLFPEKDLYLFDTFTGFDDRDLQIERQEVAAGRNAGKYTEDFSDTSVEAVRGKLPHPEKAVFCKGYFPESLSQLPEGLPTFSLVHLDLDLFAPTYEGLKIFVPRLAPGGVVLVHDYDSQQFPGVKMAVDRYCREEGKYIVPLMDLHGTVLLVNP